MLSAAEAMSRSSRPDPPEQGAPPREKVPVEPFAPPAPPAGVDVSPRAEEDLVRAAQRGDAVALASLVDRLAPFVGRICGPIALEHGEDAAQEALIAVLRDLPALREPRALYGWARRIAAREAVRHARAARREGAFGDEAQAGALPAAGDPALASDVRRVLAGLGAEQRAILVLRDLEGLSEQEAASALAVEHGTVKSRLSRARAAFRRRWSS
jgi:RNA polymerase sigma-70 factor (ECF subfamily)